MEGATSGENLFCFIKTPKMHADQASASFNPFPAIHGSCLLLSHLFVTLVAYIANNMDPDQTALRPDLREQSDQGS